MALEASSEDWAKPSLNYTRAWQADSSYIVGSVALGWWLRSDEWIAGSLHKRAANEKKSLENYRGSFIFRTSRILQQEKGYQSHH